MPPIKKIKLNRNLVSDTTRGWLTEHVFARLGARVETPRRVDMIESKNRPRIVVKNDVGIKTASDETACLKQVIVVLLPGGTSCFRAWLVETAILVDLGKLCHHIVVVPVEHDQEDAASRRKPKNSLGTEAIRLEKTVLEGPHGLLLHFISTV